MKMKKNVLSGWRRRSDSTTLLKKGTGFITDGFAWMRPSLVNAEKLNESEDKTDNLFRKSTVLQHDQPWKISEKKRAKKNLTNGDDDLEKDILEDKYEVENEYII